MIPGEKKERTMPPKGKADTAGYQKFKKRPGAESAGQAVPAVRRGDLTCGTTTWGKLKEQILSGGLGEFNFHQLSAKDMSPHALEEAIDCCP